MQIRPATCADQPSIIQLIDGVYREHGDVIHVGGADADLLNIDSHYVQLGGAFVVLAGQRVHGTHAVLPMDGRPNVCTFRRLYLDRALRGQGWGDALMQWAIDWAVQHNFDRVEFWSDTRFQRAHHFFQRHGFIRDGRVREMDDGAMPYREYFFARDLNPPTTSNGEEA